jgi:hypothetical protein
MKEIDQFVFINKYINHYIKTDTFLKNKRSSFLFLAQKSLKYMYIRATYSNANVIDDIDNIDHCYSYIEKNPSSRELPLIFNLIDSYLKVEYIQSEKSCFVFQNMYN